MKKGKVALIGFSGTGKSAVTQCLSKCKGLHCVDLDSEVESRTGQRVSEIIRVEGEEAFRALEEEVLTSLFASQCDVISLGGGALICDNNRKLIGENAFVVQLVAEVSTIVKRVFDDEVAASRDEGGSLRPLLLSSLIKLESSELVAVEIRRNVESLMRERRGLYDLADLTICTDFLDSERVAELVAEERILWLSNQQKQVSYGFLLPAEFEATSVKQLLVVGSNTVQSLGARLKAMFPKANKAVLLIDKNVDVDWGNILMEAVQGWDLQVVKLVLPSGETSKQLTEVERLADEMLSAGVARTDVLVACGGGVVGDLGGLLASLYMRGIELVHVPTTVVAQVDSALGGKTAVNLPGGKNILGTFYPARLTLSDQRLLSTLPEREYLAGIAEVVKYGLIMSEDFFVWLEGNTQQLLARDSLALDYVVKVSSQCKIAVVSEDLEDRTGRRALLNFGHTVGHAVERLTEYKTFLHGEAVAIGMVSAMRMGEHLGLAQVALTQRASKLLVELGLPIEIPRELVSSPSHQKKHWHAALLADKKRASDMIDFVIVEELGNAQVHQVSLELVVEHVVKKKLRNLKEGTSY